MNRKKAAHFLLIPELLNSPPNNAIIRSYVENNYLVDVFSPGDLPKTHSYSDSIRLFRVDYSWSWILKNTIDRRWLTYNIISGTSEDPLIIVGLISWLYNKKSICIVDEIKSGTYRGDRSEIWKDLCRWAIRKSNLRIVNDESRIRLLQEYSNIKTNERFMVYPGCYYERPERSKEKRQDYRHRWGLNQNDFVIGSSGGFNLTAGADWLLKYAKYNEEVCAVIQPLGVTPLCMYLLKNFDSRGRIYIQENRIDWSEAWESAQALDAGLCIYKNQAPQFQHMGISSNRLCMFIAMGVPVIATKQKSFEFLEKYNCGILVSDYEDFAKGITTIKENLSIMRLNCEACFQEYIRPNVRYEELVSYMRDELK